MFGRKLRLTPGNKLVELFLPSHVNLKTWKIGECIGGEWEILGILSGGFGTVYLATNRTFSEANPAMPKLFALKTFRPEVFQGAITFDDFEREAYVWLKLGKHVNILHAILLERYERIPFVVCEGIVNKRYPNSLRGWINAQKKLATPSSANSLAALAISFGIQICIGMEFANFMGVKCHRDLKPENLFVTDDLLVKIGDWGLSMLTSTALMASITFSCGPRFPFSSQKLSCQNLAGTIPYMAPEVLKGDPPSIASDIYAFGTIMYEMLALRLPFQATTNEEWVSAHCSQNPAPLESCCDVPDGLVRLVLKCLAKAPGERPTSFASLKTILNDLAIELSGRGFSSAFLNAENGGSGETNVERMNRATALHQLGAEEEAQHLMKKCVSPEDAKKNLIIVWDDEKYPGFYTYKLGKWQISFPPELVAADEEKVRNCTEDAGAWISLGNTYHFAGRLADARSAYHHAFQLEPLRKEECEHLIEQIDKCEFQDCFDRGAWCEQRGDHAGAVKAYERGLELDPTDAMLWYNLGTVKVQIGDWVGAVDALGRATHEDPNFVTAWNSLGIAYTQLAKLAESVACFDEAISLDPSFKKAWYNRSTTLMMLGRRGEAMESIRKALEIDPEYEMALNALAQYVKEE